MINRYGRLITPHREQQLRRYTTARLDLAELYAKRGLSDVYYYALRIWVYDFERFMCRGLTEGRTGQLAAPDNGAPLPGPQGPVLPRKRQGRQAEVAHVAALLGLGK